MSSRKMEELNSSFDVIVLGTGLGESMVAAGATRVGLSVLHLDSAPFYGGAWASFHLNGLADWLTGRGEQEAKEGQDSFKAHVAEGEYSIGLLPQEKVVGNPGQWHVAKAEPPAPAPTSSPAQSEKAETETEREAEGAELDEEEKTTGTPKVTDEDEKTVEETVEEKRETEEERLSRLRLSAEEDYRRFSLDLTPKALLSRGKMVEVMIRSGVHRYAEFLLIDRILTLFQDTLRTVPMSRSDVFQSNDVSMIEKRKLMKFLTAVIQPDPEDAESSEETFGAFLNESDLTPLLRHYILSIAFATETTNKAQGLSRLRSFLGSVGRFGSSPYLYTLYGSGEMPQFFCRLAAVFGATYCLDRPIDGLVAAEEVDEETGETKQRISGVVVGGQRIACRWLVAGPDFYPALVDRKETGVLHRAVLLTSASLRPNDQEDQRAHVS